MEGISNAELAHGRKLLHPECEVEVSQFDFRRFGNYGGRVKQFLAFANEKHFVVQSLGEFDLYNTTRYSYKLIN